MAQGLVGQRLITVGLSSTLATSASANLTCSHHSSTPERQVGAHLATYMCSVVLEILLCAQGPNWELVLSALPYLCRNESSQGIPDVYRYLPLARTVNSCGAAPQSALFVFLCECGSATPLSVLRPGTLEFQPTKVRRCC